MTHLIAHSSSTFSAPPCRSKCTPFSFCKARTSGRNSAARTSASSSSPSWSTLSSAGERGSDDHGLGAQATNAIASLAASLEWHQYRAVLRRFLSFVGSKPELQKRVIRLLDKTIESLADSVTKLGPDDPMVLDEPGIAKKQQRRLAATLPERQKLCDEVSAILLPSLLAYLHDKDESTVSARVPVAAVIVKLLNMLPSQDRDRILPGVLTDVCHILRSKAWESREMAGIRWSRSRSYWGPPALASSSRNSAAP